MRIVHLSDLHAVCRPRLGELRPDKRLLGTFNHYLRRAREHDWTRVQRAVARTQLLTPDLVLITGDLATTSQPAEFAQALATLAPLVADTRFELLYVPGNHDHYVARAAGYAALCAAFHTLNRGRWQLADLPLVHDVSGLRLVLVNQARPGRLYLSDGALAPPASATLAAHFADPQFKQKQRRVGLVAHFPLADALGQPLGRRRGCQGDAVLQQAFKQGVIDLAFCGHIHHPFVRWEAHGSVECCAGSVTHSGVFSLLDYDPASGRLEHQWIDVDSADTPAAPPLNPLPLLQEG